MKLGLVIGTVVATRKDERLVGSKLLVTHPITIDGTLLGEPIIAVDTVGAGAGEKVIYVQGSVASRAICSDMAPADAAIIGIVDHVEIHKVEGVSDGR